MTSRNIHIARIWRQNKWFDTIITVTNLLRRSEGRIYTAVILYSINEGININKIAGITFADSGINHTPSYIRGVTYPFCMSGGPDLI